tara:strand:- start:929 stop:1924 length:996 start_codon:yes stop_codon:yes gene_type:complete
MFDSNNVAVIGALALTVAAFTIGMSDAPILEHYGAQMQTRAVPTMAASMNAARSGQMSSASPAMLSGIAQQRVPRENFRQSSALPAAIGTGPRMQPMIATRFYSGSLPASITYRPPSFENMAYNPTTPFTASRNTAQTALGYGSKLKEGFCGGGAAPSGMHMMSDGSMMAGNTHEGFNMSGSAPIGLDGSMVVNSANPSLLAPVLSGTAMGITGSQLAADAGENPVIFDRFITANLNSRLRSQGDKIRGDLAIAPCNSGWFQVSANPALDLEPGALAVLGGTFNEQGQSVASLVNMASGGARTAISGVDMTTSINTCLAGAGNDVTAVAFP